jgi:hypothetical protein
MINNASDRLSGLRLDEATIRGLWEVEFKLTSEAWQALPRGRNPAAITLAADNPLQIQFADQGVEILLRTVSCELDGNVRDTEPREFRMRYQLVKDDTGAHFIQQEAGATAPLPDDIAIVWKEVLGRFFGKSIRPMPKFRNQAFPQFLQLGYLELDGGWLVIGAARVPEASSAITTVSAEERP